MTVTLPPADPAPGEADFWFGPAEPPPSPVDAELAHLRHRLDRTCDYTSLALATRDVYRASSYARVSALRRAATDAVDAAAAAVDAHDAAAATAARVVDDVREVLGEYLHVAVFDVHGPDSTRGEGWQRALAAVDSAFQLLQRLTHERQHAVTAAAVKVPAHLATAAAAVAAFERAAAAVTNQAA